VVVQGDYAFVGMSEGLLVLDVTDKSQPVQVARLGLVATHLDIEGHYLYAASRERGLFVVDISDPTAPQVVGSSDILSNDVEAVGNRAYVLSEGQLHIVDVSNPAAPTPLGLYEANGATDVKVAGDYAYLLVDHGETERLLEVVNIADGSAPTLVGRYQTGYYVLTDLDVAGNFVYVTTTRRHDFDYPLLVIDVSNPASPTLVSETARFRLAGHIVVEGDYAYIFGTDLSIVDIRNPLSPTTVSMLPPACLYFGCGQDLAVSDGFVYIGGLEGLEIVDVSPPNEPSRAGEYPGVYTVDVDGEGSYAYMTGSPGVQVLDATNPAAATVVGTGLEEARGIHIAVQGHYAYVTGYDQVTGAPGLRVVDVMTPTAPLRVGYTDAVTLASIAVSDTYLYAGSASGFQVVDVSDPTNPTEVGHLPTPSQLSEVAVAGDTAYGAAGSNGLRIIDVSTPTSPGEIGTFRPTRGDGSPVDVHGVVVSGSLAYVDDRSTLYVVDVSNPEAPQQRGYYDMGHIDDVAVEANHAYVLGEGRMRVVNAASPVDLREVGSYIFLTPVHGRIDVTGDRVYIAGGDEGFLILRATTLPHSVWLPLAQRE
jgi:hypothetical protein